MNDEFKFIYGAFAIVNIKVVVFIEEKIYNTGGLLEN